MTFNKFDNMNRNTKIALMIAGIIAVGVTVYLLTRKKKTDSGDETKDNRVVLFKRPKA